MEGAFTETRPGPRAADPDQVVFALDQHDFVACRMFLYDRGFGRVSETPSEKRAAALDWILAVVCGLLAPVAGLAVGATLAVPTRASAEVVGEVALIMAVVAAAGLIAGLVFAARAGRRGRSAVTPRDVYWRHLREMAQQLEAEGDSINRARIHWLLLDDDGMTEISELHQEGEVTRHQTREARTPWEQLQEVTVAEHDVFLLTRRGTVHVVPIPAFANREAALEFVERVRAYQQQALKRGPAASAGQAKSEAVRPVEGRR